MTAKSSEMFGQLGSVTQISDLDTYNRNLTHSRMSAKLYHQFRVKTVKHHFVLLHINATCFGPYYGPSSGINTYQKHKYVCI